MRNYWITETEIIGLAEVKKDLCCPFSLSFFPKSNLYRGQEYAHINKLTCSKWLFKETQWLSNETAFQFFLFFPLWAWLFCSFSPFLSFPFFFVFCFLFGLVIILYLPVCKFDKQHAKTQPDVFRGSLYIILGDKGGGRVFLHVVEEKSW